MNRNLRTLLILLTIAFAMVGVAYAFVPLYRIMCQKLGIPLPSVEVSDQLAAPKQITTTSNRIITVRFIGMHNATMPVKLAPVVYSLQVQLGKPVLTAYKANNPTSQNLDGVAVHTLFAMGGTDGIQINNFVDLQQCFCFQSQHYPAKQEIMLPLSFTITPDLPPDIHTVTFSYTLFPEETGKQYIKADKDHTP